MTVKLNTAQVNKREAIMKTFISILLILVIVSTVTIQSKPIVNAVKTAQYELIEANRLIGLQSDNEGLRISCAYFLGEMKSSKAVHPLMEMLRTEQNCPARIVAALSLVKIGDPQGVYMVSRVAKFTDCEKTKKFCEKFYNSFMYHQYLEKHGLQDQKLVASKN